MTLSLYCFALLLHNTDVMTLNYVIEH